MKVSNSIPQCEVPTVLWMEVLKLLDMLPPMLEDWIQTTGFGPINYRDRQILAQVNKCKAMQSETTKSTEPTVESTYGKPLSELKPPKDCIFTGEFRVPRTKAGVTERFLGIDRSVYNTFQFTCPCPRLLLSYIPTISGVYGKPPSELSPPKGHLFTGEFRVPKVGEPFLTNDGVSLCIHHYGVWARLWAPRLILRKVKTLDRCFNPVEGVSGQPRKGE